jgi:outer membrane lipoprotein SlyB
MMQFKYAVSAAAVVLSLSACQRTEYASNSNYSAPPLQAQPVSPVQSGQLPPAGGSQFPAAPATTAPMPGAVQNSQLASTGGMDVTKESMVGSWKVNNGGSTCDMFLTLTNLGGGSRGGTRGCVGPLTTMGSWEVSGRQVVLRDRDGNTIGTLAKTADSQLSGSTAGGQPISLSR